MKKTIALSIGDPAGIGPEIVLKALDDERVTDAANIIVVGEAVALTKHATACGLEVDITATDIRLPGGRRVPLLQVESLGNQPWELAEIAAVSGRACWDYALKAIDMVRRGEAAAVIAAPHTEAAVNAAGYHFRGYPSLVAEATGTPDSKVFLMLLSPVYRVVNATLHEPLADAIRRIDQTLVLAAIEAAHSGLQALGLKQPYIGVCGINPHAGEGGIMGTEDDTIVAPAVAQAASRGINVDGPWPADAVFAARRHDAYIAMYHDQGHVPVKVASPLEATAITVGTPVPFGSVAHGSALDIAGKGLAKPNALINALLNIAS